MRVGERNPAQRDNGAISDNHACRREFLIETPFFENLAKETGLSLSVNFNPMDVVNVKPEDALRLLRSGTFDVMSVQIGQASRDDPFFEGVDLAGVSTNFPDLKAAIDAYRTVFDERLQRRFNAKVLTLWPFGPQVFYCNKPVASVDDFKGLKIRSFTPTMSGLLQKLGATPVTLSFTEVYSALGNKLVDCGVTSPNSGNTGKWPEVTTHYVPLAVNGSVQGHFINLAYWNKFTPADQAKLLAAFKKLEDAMWNYAVTGTDDSQSCNTGGECKNGQKFNMTLVKPSKEDAAKLAAAAARCPSGGMLATRSTRPARRPGTRRSVPRAESRLSDPSGRASGFACLAPRKAAR